MSVRDTVEIGLTRFARRGYDLDEVSIVPSRRTRDMDDVSTAWQIDAFRFDIPLVTSPSDAVVSVSPQHTLQLAPAALAAGVDLLVIQGTIVSAEHVTTQGDALNLKEFIADLDVPVIVGGAANYQTALHLMRTGAAGVIVGVGADSFSTGDVVMGIRVPLASAIADAAAARRDYLDETGGRYVHVIANGRIETSGAIAKAIACGADAVVLGEPLRAAQEAPGGGIWWDSVAAHPRLPRGGTSAPVSSAGSLHDVLLGEARAADGRTNLFGALRRTMAKTGYRDLKEFQRVDLVIGGQGED